MAQHRIEKLLATYVPLPMCIINYNGKVTRASGKIDEVFIYDGIRDADIFALTGIKLEEYQKAAKGEKKLMLSRNDKTFRMQVLPVSEEENASLAIYFLDVTGYESLKAKYNDERTCIGIIHVDNYDELKASNSDEMRLTILTEADRKIRQWCLKINASVHNQKDHIYFVIFENQYLEKMIENKFGILDDIRSIESESDFPVTLSVGIGAGGKNLAQTHQFAQDAMDLALGRGGDQAVIKRGSRIEYFGGKMKTVEKSNKGKSRIVAHALRQLIDQSSRVMIMGHRYPDMDAFGAALGIYRIAAARNKEAHIIINAYNETLHEVYTLAKESEAYSFINNEKAIAMSDKETLMVILDTHRPSLVECPELFGITDRIAVIDHHRRAEESIENATLAYMETYASSTCELVTEILQYSLDKKGISKFEAEALLAGITVDTNRFSVKTGVRTFEAASWLRRSGADTSSVKRYFQSDVEAFKLRANTIVNARISERGFAYSICEGIHPDMQIINAQAADELLAIKGVIASFVAGVAEGGKTVISARSLGEINVQALMEKLGGGGHLTTAGAQVDVSPEEALDLIRRETEKIEE